MFGFRDELTGNINLGNHWPFIFLPQREQRPCPCMAIRANSPAWWRNAPKSKQQRGISHQACVHKETFWYLKKTQAYIPCSMPKTYKWPKNIIKEDQHSKVWCMEKNWKVSHPTKLGLFFLQQAEFTTKDDPLVESIVCNDGLQVYVLKWILD